MFRALLITTAAAGLLAAIPATPARAQPPAPMADSPWQGVAKQALPVAIAAAEQFSGGRVLEIRFRVRQGAPGFDAVIAKADVFSHLRIELPSRRVTLIAETEVPAALASWVLTAGAKSLDKAQLQLADAVREAEEMTDAPAANAAVAKPLTASNDVLAYEVQVIRDGRSERVVIDAMTGQKIANPASLLAGWSPEQALYASLAKAARTP